VTLEQHARRVKDGIDPMTHSARDGVNNGQHRAPATSSSFTSNQAYAQAELKTRESPWFESQAKNGQDPIVVKDLEIKDALGPNHERFVVGLTKKNAQQGTLLGANYSRGRITAVYDAVRDTSGKIAGYKLRTLYPTPTP
jgi:hypothetical protein